MSGTRKFSADGGGPRQQRLDQQRSELASRVRRWTVDDFRWRMEELGIYRTYLTFENGVFNLAHPDLLEPVQAFFELSQDFGGHEGVFIGREDNCDSLFFAFVHDTRRGLAQGGLRFWRYETMSEVLVDGLRLAQGMTRKNALANLWWGGGKGIITLPSRFQHPNEFGINTPELREERRRYFEAYGRFVASLGGVYYTAEDVGTFTPDMEALLSQNRFTTCIPAVTGGSGNPSPFTARGVFRAMQAGWHFLDGGTLKGVKVSVQGAGNVGKPLIRELYQAGAEIWIADINPDNLAEIKKELPKVHILADPEKVFDQRVDIFAPCARGAVVNIDTIPRLKRQGVKLVCGAANNILKEPQDADRLRENGIGYVPDFLCNRMGIVNCADEWMGYLKDDVQVAAEQVYPDTLRVFKHARNLVINTAKAADLLADIAAAELHPIMGHRGRRIIDNLMHSGWAEWDGRSLPAATAGKPAADAFEPAMHEAPIRHDWDHAKVFRGNSPAIAGEPVSTAGAPNLAGFFIPLLMDVRVRALQRFSGQKPRRVLGTDHGGLSLQNAVERTIPQSREALGRENFQEMCLDFHSRNDAAIRQQLHLLGVGYDSKGWLNPMNRSGQETVSAVFEALNRSGLIERRDYFAYQNPTRGTILVNQDVVMEPPTSIRFTINFAVDGSKTVIETGAFLPELVLGAVAIAVNTRGKFASLVGKFAIHPVNERRLAVVGVDDLEVPAKFLVPAHSQQDAEMAAQLGISERLTVYDELGRINPRHGMEGDARDIRDLVIRRLGKAVHQEIGSWNVPRCARTESLVIEGVSQQLFVNLQPMKAHLRQAIESGEVAFNQAGWQRHALDFLERHDHWCISRQHWWGNDVPVAPNQDVLSTWFSMAAMALRGAGWPDSHHPAPVEEVFCSPVFLERWVIPAQLIALAITGRPVFNRIQVFGSLSLVERQLQETGIPDGGIPDEQRFVMRSIRKPMRTDTGNQIQPRALMDRFGADALRLGYLLCADNGDKRSLTLSESQLRKARRALKVLSTKIGGVLNIARRNDNGISINLFDEWIVSHCRQVRDRARELYQNCAYGEVAELLVDTIEHIKQYINVAARRKKSASGALRVTIGRVMAITEEAFSPICPFIFQHLKAETARIASATSGYQEQAWLSDLVAHLRSLKKEAVLSSPDPLLLDQLESALPEFARLSGIRLSVSHQPAAGKTAVFGRCLVVESGELEISGGGEAVLEWYRRILG